MWHAFSAGLGLALILLVDRAYRAWRGVSGIGLGDAKLFAASGAWLGAEAFLTVLLWTCASALAVLGLARGFGRQVDAPPPVRIVPRIRHLARLVLGAAALNLERYNGTKTG